MSWLMDLTCWLGFSMGAIRRWVLLALSLVVASRGSSRLRMAGPAYPLTIRSVVTRMTEGTQRALQQRTTRMEVLRSPLFAAL